MATRPGGSAYNCVQQVTLLATVRLTTSLSKTVLCLCHTETGVAVGRWIECSCGRSTIDLDEASCGRVDNLPFQPSWPEGSMRLSIWDPDECYVKDLREAAGKVKDKVA